MSYANMMKRYLTVQFKNMNYYLIMCHQYHPQNLVKTKYYNSRKRNKIYILKGATLNVIITNKVKSQI